MSAIQQIVITMTDGEEWTVETGLVADGDVAKARECPGEQALIVALELPGDNGSYNADPALLLDAAARYVWETGHVPFSVGITYDSERGWEGSLLVSRASEPLG